MNNKPIGSRLLIDVKTDENTRPCISCGTIICNNEINCTSIKAAVTKQKTTAKIN